MNEYGVAKREILFRNVCVLRSRKYFIAETLPSCWYVAKCSVASGSGLPTKNATRMGRYGNFY